MLLAGLFRTKSRRRNFRQHFSGLQVVDVLEAKTLLSGTNDAPVITYSTANEIFAYAEVDADENGISTTVFADFDNDGVFEESEALPSNGDPAWLAIPGGVPRNSSIQIQLKAVTNFDSGGPSGEGEVRDSGVATVTANGLPLLPITTADLDISQGFVWGTIDINDIDAVGSFSIALETPNGWVTIGGADPYGNIAAELPSETEGTIVTVATVHTVDGVSVYGTSLTALNEGYDPGGEEESGESSSGEEESEDNGSGEDESEDGGSGNSDDDETSGAFDDESSESEESYEDYDDYYAAMSEGEYGYESSYSNDSANEDAEDYADFFEV